MTFSNDPSINANQEGRPVAGGSGRDAWRTPTVRVLAARVTEGGTPDDTKELPLYETKPS